MATTFPLLRLPYLVLMPVLEHMEFMDKIALSILSKRARMYVKLLKMKCKRINLILKDNKIEMIVFFEISKELRVDMYIDVLQRSNFIFRYKQFVSWCDGSLLPVDYVLSIMDVTHCKSIYHFVVSEISEHDSIPIIAKLAKIDEVVVEFDWSSKRISYEALFQKERQLLRVLRTVFPVSSAVFITYQFQNRNHLREILKGNLDAVILKNSDNWINLNDLWITNARTLEIHTQTLNVRDLNRYFKLWMKKICNDRLEYLEVRIYDKISVDLLLNGLNAVPVPIETKREFRVLGNLKQVCWYENITAEFDITRADGKTATIRLNGYDYIHFYVWPESTNLVPNQSSLISTTSISTGYGRQRRGNAVVISVEGVEMQNEEESMNEECKSGTVEKFQEHSGSFGENQKCDSEEKTCKVFAYQIMCFDDEPMDLVEEENNGEMEKGLIVY
ncbi:hypothetical protein GCK72_021261 [Caenorhabditis remanei]|uniref:F-box domain-containing protein n=1 Tax=Caenorhabditis remanei TaxID=31234 RepID=A0A6A5GHJ3_CAERE|nr:hypothetical protein GCK72_021261 [Caenorhabditis remanei]KAF1754697.1 hypothetical protein GCK72_021261 [Caenorhabditis remanei]